MKLKVKPKTLWQYISILFIIFINQSSWFTNLFSSENNNIILAITFVLLVFSRKKYEIHTVGYVMLLLALCAAERFIVGGVGINTWTIWAIMISASYYAIVINGDKFPDRFVKVIYILCIGSLVGFVIAIILPDFIRTIGFTYLNKSQGWIWQSATTHTNYYRRTYDILFYVLNEQHATRNCGVFTEPGIFQMFINTALFMLFFMRDKISIRPKIQTRMVIVFIVTMLTTQSTTGLIGLVGIVVVYILSTNNGSDRMRRRFGIIALLGSAIILFDYSYRGYQSFIGRNVISKLMSSSGSFDLAANTGAARVGTIALCFASMIRHPLGIGFDAVHSLLNVDVTGYLAAQIMQTGAAMGIVTFIAILVWCIVPCFVFQTSKLYAWLFVFLYFNTALAQSREFYPALIIIPLQYYYYRKTSDNIKTSRELKPHNEEM